MHHTCVPYSVQANPYHGISASVFPESIVKTLLAPVSESDIEMKPDGLIYLPEIKYRRILNLAFGPGGWALMPRGDTLHFQVRGISYPAACVPRLLSSLE